MKSQFAESGKETNPWEFITILLTVLDTIKIKISPAFADSLNSQSSLTQLHKGNVNLVGLALYAPESNIAKGLLSKGIVRNGSIKQINPAKLTNIATNKNYFDLINKEIQFALSKKNAPTSLGLPSGTKLKLIKSMSEYDKNDLNTIHCFIIMEGLHGLINNPTASNAKTELLKNLKTFTNTFKIFAANITHLQQMPLANHASGIQFLSDEDFYPTGNGISAIGKEIILELYNKNILVDVKHLGLWSRMNLYTIRNDENRTLPLICTHAGVTGISYKERLAYIYDKPKSFDNKVWRFKQYKKLGIVPHAAFNLSSINLYDEDIVQILGSKGLIGISLDQRIIGFPADSVLHDTNGFPYDEEFISIKEQTVFFGPKQPDKLQLSAADEDLVMSGDMVTNQIGFTEELHLYYFWNQVIHILSVAKANVAKGLTVEDAMQRICIGSDFDGLINPIDCCENATEYSTFKRNLKRVSNEGGFWDNTGFTAGEININKLLDGIFFTNAERFMQLNFV